MRLIITDFDKEFVNSGNLDANIKYMKECMDKGDSFVLDSYLLREDAERLAKENDIPYSLLSLYGGAIVYDNKGIIQSYSEIQGDGVSSIIRFANTTNNVSVKRITVEMKDRSDELRARSNECNDFSEPKTCALILTLGAGFTKKVRVRLKIIEDKLSDTFAFKRLNTGKGVQLLVTNIIDLPNIISEIPTRRKRKVKVIDIRNRKNKGSLLEQEVDFKEDDLERVE